MSRKKDRYDDKYFESKGILHHLFFLNPLKVLRKARKGYLEKEDMYKLAKDQDFTVLYSKFNRLYMKMKPKGHSTESVYWRCIRQKWNVAVFYFLLEGICLLFLPIVIKWLTNWFNSGSKNAGEAYYIIGFTSVLLFFQLMSQQHGLKITFFIQNQIIAIFYGSYFNKLKKISLKATSKVDIGKVINSSSVDIEKIHTFTAYSTQAIVSLFALFVLTYLSYVEIGWIIFLGISFMLILTFLQFKLGGFGRFFISKKLEQADTRNSFINSAVNGIKEVKFNVWEDVIINKIRETRKKERKYAFGYIFLNLVVVGSANIISLVSALICIIIYMKTTEIAKRNLGTMFFIVSAFQSFNGALRTIALFIKSFYDSRVAFRRLDETLSLRDFGEETIIQRTNLLSGECEIKRGDFSYTSNDNPFEKPVPILQDINFKVNQGEFVAIIGPSGCGKTSLLNTLCDRMYCLKGQSSVNGKIGYVPQKPFLINSSFKNNITFGHTHVPFSFLTNHSALGGRWGKR